MIKVTINNTIYMLENQCTVYEAIRSIEKLPKMGIAVAVNNDVIPSSQWASKKLTDGDKITIIKAFYGG